MPKQFNEREKFELEEKYLWFLGNEDMLADFYQTRTINSSVIDTRGEYYYSKVGSNVRIIHSGMPSLISYSKARLLTSGGIEYKVEIKEKENEEKTQLLEDIYNDNKMDSIIKTSILTESWGTKFAWKISNDPEMSDYPIIEMYNPFNYECIYKRGRLQAIIFKSYYEKGNKKFELREIYGKGFIDYKLFLVTADKEIEYPLTELEETADLKRADFDINIILANEKCIDKSDYQGIISEFDALDEAWSQLMDEIRLARSEVYVPEMLMESKTFNKFRKNFAVLGTDMHENGKNEIKHIQPEIRSEQYSNSITNITNNILINVGLSPYTVGIQDDVGANASGENLTKREMTSLRTRKEMVDSWKEFLEETFKIILQAYDIFNKKSYVEYELDVDFGKYISPTREELIKNTVEMKNAGIIDVEKAIDEIYEDTLEEEEKLRMIANGGEVSFKEEPQIEE